MPTDIVIPSLGESISEGVIASWLKQDGDYVERDEPILELETDKITTEIPAPAAGVIHPSAGEGDTVSVGQTIGSIEESEKPAEKGEAEEKKSTAAKKKRTAKKAAAAEQEAEDQEQEEEAEAEAAPQARSRATEPARVAEGAASKTSTGAGAPGLRGGEEAYATPLARKMAQDHGVDLGSISGTGAGGRIREQDVLAWIQTHPNGSPAGAQQAARPAAAPSGDRSVSRQKMSPLRQRIAQRLVEAQQTAAMLTTFNECDMSAVMDLRKRYKDDFEKKHGVRLGFMSFFVKACVSALQTFDRVNSQIGQNDDGDPEIVHFDYCDIAVAVGTEKGLVVPVLRNCESLSFADIESGIRDLAEKAQKGKLSLEDMQGGTFTISNGGVYGSMMSTPILNPPQSAILGMHNIVRRPVEDPSKPGSGDVTVRPMMYLALSYDHRLIDGAEAVGFLKHVKECIEDPERLLLGV